ncbi:MBL fold metallo-hydrolase [Caldanaerobius polysaccharolyticus]|uniref:MBL fold metallo-hydrolase n=1 Tax=Caldanaerobius polysaccharolyticus TaxID=44256 RepID=UPI00047C7AA2|nr:MBL fold metallo-hydrolase [Caldanaerobius polysaccharolyticus]
MRVTKYISESMQENCYVLEDEKSKACAVIDPGDFTDDLLAYIGNLKVQYILLTHGHFDHIWGVEKLKAITSAPVAIHQADGDMLRDPESNLSAFTGKSIAIEADVLLNDGDLITIGELEVKVLHTPGHTPGSVCYACGGVVFSGDTIFAGSVGRTDFPGGDAGKLVDSVDMMIKSYPGVALYPGHGEMTTMEEFARSWESLKNWL